MNWVEYETLEKALTELGISVDTVFEKINEIKRGYVETLKERGLLGETHDE